MLLTLPVIKRMEAIDGWLTAAEADLLLAGVRDAIGRFPSVPTVVEIGSYAGRSTAVIASAATAVRRDVRVYAIDPHEGYVTDNDLGLQSSGETTLERFRAHISAASLEHAVVAITKPSYEVDWHRPIAFLYIDGLHDAENVARDFNHFERWLPVGGYVAFHDYSDEWPAVRAFVDQITDEHRFEPLQTIESMILLRRGPSGSFSAHTRPPGSARPTRTELLGIGHLAALAGGYELLARAGKPAGVRSKNAAPDLVSDADIAADAVIREIIQTHRPHDTIISEESSEHAGSTGVQWTVDPLDGTINYLAGASEWAVSIATKIGGGGGGVDASVVHAPALGCTYTAIRNGGARCNAQRLEPVKPRQSGLLDCVAATGFAADPHIRRQQLEQLSTLLPFLRDVRCRGAASLELCAVASQHIDAYIESHLKPWDIAAGALIAEECGIAVTGTADTAGEPLLAAAPEVAHMLRQVLAARDSRLP